MQLVRLVNELANREHEVTVAASHNPDFEQDFYNVLSSNVNLRFIAFDGFRLSLKAIRSVFALREMIKEIRPDIVHVHKGTTLDLTILAVIGLDVPVVANRGMSAALNRLNAWKYRSRKVATIVAVAQNVKGVLVKTGNIDPNKIEVIYGSVDAQQFSPDVGPVLRDELRIAKNEIVFGYLGSARRRKGLNHLFDAFCLLHEKYPAAHFVMVGVSEDAIQKSGYQIPAKLRGALKLIPFRQDVAQCLASFDVLLFAGTRNEGLTGVLREALAVGTPVVSSDVGGNGELIDSGVRDGFIVAPGDHEQMAEAAGLLADDATLRRELGWAGRDWVSRYMTETARANQVEALYTRLLKNTSRLTMPTTKSKRLINF